MNLCTLSSKLGSLADDTSWLADVSPAEVFATGLSCVEFSTGPSWVDFSKVWCNWITTVFNMLQNNLWGFHTYASQELFHKAVSFNFRNYANRASDKCKYTCRIHCDNKVMMDQLFASSVSLSISIPIHPLTNSDGLIIWTLYGVMPQELGIWLFSSWHCRALHASHVVQQEQIQQ